jgi:hypothetical protein
VSNGAGNRVKTYPGLFTDLDGTGLSRGNRVRVLAAVFNDLPLDYAAFRNTRDPEDTDCFLYPLEVVQGDVKHQFIFRVNDTQAPPYLFVRGLRHRTRPLS